MILHRLISAFIAAVSLAVAVPAYASCQVSNETGSTFTIESGNTSNQRVGGHTSTTIAAGKIIGKSDDGKTIGGFCKDGDQLVIKEEKGVPYIAPKK